MKRIINIDEIHCLELGILKEIKRICEKYSIVYYLHAGTVLGAVRHKGFIPWDEDGDIIIPITEVEKFIDACKKDLNPKYCLQTWKDRDFSEYFMRVVLNNQDPMCAYIDIFYLIGASDKKKTQLRFLKKQDLLYYLRALRFLKLKEVKGSVLKKGVAWIAKCFSSIIPISILNKFFFHLIKTHSFVDSPCVHCSYGRYKMDNYFTREVFDKPEMLVFEGIDFPVPVGFETELKQFYGDYNTYPPQSVIEKGLKHTAIFIESES